MMTNSEILNSGSPAHLFTSIDKQRRFILRQIVQDRPCPNCGTMQNLFIAAGVDVDDLDLMSGTGFEQRPMKCVCCRRALKWTLPWPTGVWYWRLEPVRPEPGQWPRHDDGRPKKIGEMEPAERSKIIQRACERVKAEFESPAMQEAMKAVLTAEPASHAVTYVGRRP